MSLIAFDTQLLIWGVQGIAEPTQRGMIARTQALLERLRQTKDRVIVPMPAAMEYVCGFPIAEQKRQWPVLSRRFRLVPFDLRAAMLAAEIERKRVERSRNSNSQKKPRRSAPDLAELTRQQIKVDVQILSIALAAGATRILTHDTDHFISIAQGYSIQIQDVPAAITQPSLPFPD